ncbi:pyridoxamine 5'-phosphate oxidase family protein [Paradesulfitobacterium aromaticivorans]
MKEVIDFLYANPIGCLSTVDEDGRPHVRPWEFMFEQDGKLWFCTANTKDVFGQLQCNPAIEFCSTSKENVSVRVSGEVIFGIDLNIKRKMLERNSQLNSIYKVPENPEFEIFYLKHGQATMFNFRGQLIKDMIVF